MPHPYDRRWSQLRARWAVLLPVSCCRCGKPVDPEDEWDLDHAQLDVVLGGTHEGARPAHRYCNRAAGARLRDELRDLGADVKRGFLAADAARLNSSLAEIPLQIPERPGDVGSSPGPSDPIWDRCRWLDDL